MLLPKAADTGIILRYRLGLPPFIGYTASCEASSGTVYLTNKDDGPDFAAVGRVTLGSNCNFGFLSSIIKVGSQISIYSHWLSAAPDPDTTPKIMLRGQGDVMLDIIGYYFRFAAFNFDYDTNDKILKLGGKLDLLFTKVPVIQLAGLLGPDGGDLVGAFDFTVDLPWGAVLSWYGSITISVQKEVESSLQMQGSFKLGALSMYAVASVRKMGGKVVFALCNDALPRSGIEISAILQQSPGSDNCLDLKLLFNGIPHGGTCANSQMCSSGRCDVKQNQIFGTCVDRLADGAACNENSDCLSGRCKMERLSISRPGTCRPLGNVGDSCGNDEDCVSQRCEGGALSGKCKERLADGRRCDEHSDCLSNHCKVGFINRKCAPLLARGKRCTGDRVCQSGSCSLCGLCLVIRTCD